MSIPAVSALTSIEQERRLSVGYLAQPSANLQSLVDQRKLTDQRLSSLRAAADSALGRAPNSIVTRWRTLTRFLDQLPNLRSTVDSRSGSRQQIYEFYDNLLDAATDLFNTQARVVPDVTATQGGITAVEAFRASDLMSRAASKIDGAFGARGFNQQDYLEFVRLVGAYHAALTDVAPNLVPAAGGRYAGLTGSDLWRELATAENMIIMDGVWHDGVPPDLSSIRTGWGTLTQQVSDKLIDLTVTQADEVSAQALRAGDNKLLIAILSALAALVVSGAAIWWALRKSGEMPVRLARLGEDAAALVDQRLPATMERLRRGELVDPEVELPLQNYGGDEIGELAVVLDRSLKVAAVAAITEAKTRDAGNAILRGVARRPQRPLQRALKVIGEIQNQIGDETLLIGLFDIDHQMRQVQRFLENLLILAGGQIGRRFHNPVPVSQVVRAAFAESQHYKRVSLSSAPDVAVVGQAVAGTIHLLAELIDNSLTFSPPATTVRVTSSQGARGVAVEIEDSGIGMEPDAMERANELLTTAPTPDVTVLRDGKQIGLYVVAELAKRDGIQVTLRPSAYGGLMAVVLLPGRLIADSPAADLPDARPPTAATAIQVEPAGRQGPRAAASAPIAAVAALPAHPPQPAGAMPTPRQPSVPSAIDPGSPGPQVAARRPLPQRHPQQHLAPGLRDDLPTAGTPGPDGPARSPEEARDRFSRYQEAWAAGKAAANFDTATADDEGRKA